MEQDKNSGRINYRFFLSYLRYAKLPFAAALAAVGIATAAAAALPIISASVINADFAGMTADNLKAFLIEKGVLFLLTAFVYAAGMYAKVVFFTKTANKAAEHIQMDTARRLLQLRMERFDSMTSGNIVSRFSSDVDTVRNLYATVLAEIFSTGILMAVLYITLFTIDISVFFLSIGYLPVMYLFARYYLHKSQKPIQQNRQALGELSGFLRESVAAVESIQTFCRETVIEQQFEAINNTAYSEKRKSLVLYGLFSWNIIERMRSVVYALAIGVFGLLYFKGLAIPVGTLFIIISYNGKIIDIFLMFFLQINNFKSAFVAAGRVSEVIAFEHEPSGGERHVPQGTITFQNVRFSYKADTPVLKGVSFTARKGETHAFVGKTGCGKSTIMNVLLRFYPHQEGSILFDGRAVKSLDSAALRSKIAVVLQEPYLFTGTLFDNIGLGDSAFSEAACIEALRAVGGAALLEKNTEGIHAEVRENGKNFSHGERQIICFARAMVRDPVILILDEATAHIDTETEQLINRGIAVLKQGRTTLMIAHRLSTVQHADVINVIEDGIITEQGSHEQLLALGKSYAAWYTLQTGKEEHA